MNEDTRPLSKGLSAAGRAALGFTYIHALNVRAFTAGATTLSFIRRSLRRHQDTYTASPAGHKSKTFALEIQIR